MKKKTEKNKDLFFPYYVNQGRLFDIYAILNGGYSEYEELTENVNNGAATDVSASAGFKLLKISSDMSAQSSSAKGSTVKKVQTVTSVLSMVIETLSEKSYLKDIGTAKVGSFVNIPVNLKINSLKNILDELVDVLGFAKDLESFGVDTSIPRKEIKQYEKIANSLKTYINDEEIIYENNNYAITGNISENNLYQAVKSDIVGSDIMCLAQIKRIYPSGTELMKNNTLGIIKGADMKKALFDSISAIANSEGFEFSSVAISEIKGKPVYQVEIIALYQSEK